MLQNIRLWSFKERPLSTKVIFTHFLNFKSKNQATNCKITIITAIFVAGPLGYAMFVFKSNHATNKNENQITRLNHVLFGQPKRANTEGASPKFR
jgi:hypothetical protein